MTPREHLLRLYRRQGWDHAPMHFTLAPELERAYRAAEGDDLPYAERYGFAERHLDLPPAPRAGAPEWARWHGQLAPGTRVDAWGVAHEPGGATAAGPTRMRHPLADALDAAVLDAYPWPDWRHADIAGLTAEVAAAHARGLAAVGGMVGALWEAAWHLRGLEPLLAGMAEDDDATRALFDRLRALALPRAVAYARAGCDILVVGDDVAMQDRLLLSPALWRRWLEPGLAAVIAAARAAKPDLLVMYHGCGALTPLVGNLVAVGVDILNPVQPECMDVAALVRAWGDRLSFNGLLGTQTVLPFGTPAEVRAQVHAHLALAGRRGGIVVCPTHTVDAQVPWANVAAYVAACRTFTPG